MLSVDNGPVLPMAGRAGVSPEPLNVRAEEAPHGVCRQSMGAIAQSLAGRGTLWAAWEKDGGMGWI